MTFSLALSDERQQLRDWAHEFSLKVIRPAAFDRDDREETPWPILRRPPALRPRHLDDTPGRRNRTGFSDPGRGAVLG